MKNCSGFIIVTLVLFWGGSNITANDEIPAVTPVLSNALSAEPEASEILSNVELIEGENPFAQDAQETQEPPVVLDHKMVPAVVNAEIQSITPVVEPMESIKPVSLVVDHTPFLRMKSLAGRWEGKGKAGPGQEEDQIVVTYEVSAGGNVVMERLFPGSNHEMATMYYENRGKLTLTHYCILGNRPMMELLPVKNNIFEFNLIPTTDLSPAVDTHMHSLKITFIDQGRMNQEWKMYEAGKEAGSYSFELTRSPGSP